MTTIEEKLVMTVPEAGKLLGISRAQAYLMVKRGVDRQR